jgi:hypothetical protein
VASFFIHDMFAMDNDRVPSRRSRASSDRHRPFLLSEARIIQNVLSKSRQNRRLGQPANPKANDPSLNSTNGCCKEVAELRPPSVDFQTPLLFDVLEGNGATCTLARLSFVAALR